MDILYGLIILISMVFTAYTVYKIAKIKILKYVLAPVISLLYGFMLFFIGMGFNIILFYVLAIIPIIVGALYKAK